MALVQGSHGGHEADGAAVHGAGRRSKRLLPGRSVMNSASARDGCDGSGKLGVLLKMRLKVYTFVLPIPPPIP